MYNKQHFVTFQNKNSKYLFLYKTIIFCMNFTFTLFATDTTFKANTSETPAVVVSALNE